MSDGKLKVDEKDIKMGISKMYYGMSRACRRHSKAIEQDLDGFNISNMKIGYELQTEGKLKYQLVLELKVIE